MLLFIFVACFFESFQEKTFHETMTMSWTGFQFHGIYEVSSSRLPVVYMTKRKELGPGSICYFSVKNVSFALHELTCVDHSPILSQLASISSYSRLLSIFFW